VKDFKPAYLPPKSPGRQRGVSYVITGIRLGGSRTPRDRSASRNFTRPRKWWPPPSVRDDEPDLPGAVHVLRFRVPSPDGLPCFIWPAPSWRRADSRSGSSTSPTRRWATRSAVSGPSPSSPASSSGHLRSGPATVAAIGGIMIPYMKKAGYDRTYATGLSAVGGGLGSIMPPSNPLVVYGVATKTSNRRPLPRGSCRPHRGRFPHRPNIILSKKAGYLGTAKNSA